MQFHCTEIKPVSNKYKQNKQLFRYFVQRLWKASGTKLNYEVKVANRKWRKVSSCRVGTPFSKERVAGSENLFFCWWVCRVVMVIVILWKDRVCEGTDYQHGHCHFLSQGGGQRQGQYGGGTGAAVRGQTIGHVLAFVCWWELDLIIEQNSGKVAVDADQNANQSLPTQTATLCY